MAARGWTLTQVVSDHQPLKGPRRRDLRGGGDVPLFLAITKEALRRPTQALMRVIINTAISIR
jgi:hypothetical protein